MKCKFTKNGAYSSAGRQVAYSSCNGNYNTTLAFKGKFFQEFVLKAGETFEFGVKSSYGTSNPQFTESTVKFISDSQLDITSQNTYGEEYFNEPRHDMTDAWGTTRHYDHSCDCVAFSQGGCVQEHVFGPVGAPETRIYLPEDSNSDSNDSNNDTEDPPAEDDPVQEPVEEVVEEVSDDLPSRISAWGTYNFQLGSEAWSFKYGSGDNTFCIRNDAPSQARYGFTFGMGYSSPVTLTGKTTNNLLSSNNGNGSQV